MTTPSINTPHAIISDAYSDAGLLPELQDPTPEQLAKGLRRLRDLVIFLQTQGIKLWVQDDITVPLTAGTAAYTFMTGGSVSMDRPLRVLEAYYLLTANNTRRPLSVMSLNDYWTLGQAGTLAANRGTISQYLVEKLADRMRVTFWQCPNTAEAADGAVHLLMQTQITEVTSLTETMEFPPEWRMALRWGLANDLCTGQPQAVMDRCEKWATFYRTKLEDWDVEDAPTQFQPDPRGMIGGSFR